ncbi:cytochrome P450 [Streptomyces physcomitrii]|uniref:cytochrome P450 n=1 Tax=Streptomyces physcomitrii TaxID=2724184 RepID=UPI0034082E45
MSFPPPPYYRLHTEDFAQRRHEYYADMRRHYGDLAPIELVDGVFGYLVVSHRAAADVLHDTATWTKDSAAWAAQWPADHPILGMLGPRPNPMFTDGADHARHRGVTADAFAMIEPHHLRDMVRDVADRLIDTFAADGEADLVARYARPLPSYVFNRLFGRDDFFAPRLVEGLAKMMEGGREADAGKKAFESYLMELIAEKRENPGRNLTTWMLQHPAGLDPVEIVHQVVLTFGAGQEPTTNLIASPLARLLRDDELYNQVVSGTLDVIPAIDRVLADQPPISNYGAHYPRQDLTFHGRGIPAHTLVMIGYEAIGTDPQGPGCAASGRGSHLAWSMGPHACPVPGTAMSIAETALTQLIHRLPDLELAVPETELRLRKGPFHHALASLPARFSPVRVATRGEIPWPSNPFTPEASTPSTSTAPTSPAKPHGYESWGTWLPSSCPAGYGPGHPPATASSNPS